MYHIMNKQQLLMHGSNTESQFFYTNSCIYKSVHIKLGYKKVFKHPLTTNQRFYVNLCTWAWFVLMFQTCSVLAASEGSHGGERRGGRVYEIWWEQKQVFTFWCETVCLRCICFTGIIMFICVLSADSRNIDAVRKACKDVGSISDIIFEMRFIPNVYSPGQEKIILKLTQ